MPVHRGTHYLGYYKNGGANGKFWIGMMGGNPYGHLHGIVRAADSTISGDSISYVYPDMETAFLGKFEDRVMKDAQEATVLEVDCDENGLLYVSKFSTPEMSSPHFYYEPPNNISYGAGPPLVPDPYEQKWLELKASKNPHAGEGVFIHRNVGPGEFVSIYAGFVFNKEQQLIYLRNCAHNTTKSVEQRRHCFKYALGIPTRELEINIPPEYDCSGMFQPSLGPKVSRKN